MDRAVRRCIETIEGAVGDPRRGLPEDVFLFVSRLVPLINVDLLIQDALRGTLLTWRDDEFFGAGWHVPGGIIRFQETAAERVRACAREEVGVDVSAEPAPIFVLESIRAQHTRGHGVALLFRCTALSPPDPAREAGPGMPCAGTWRWHDSPPPDLLDIQSQYAQFF